MAGLNFTSFRATSSVRLARDFWAGSSTCFSPRNMLFSYARPVFWIGIPEGLLFDTVTKAPVSIGFQTISKSTPCYENGNNEQFGLEVALGPGHWTIYIHLIVHHQSFYRLNASFATKLDQSLSTEPDHQPSQATKLLPLAPVCVISPARCPFWLKITRSAPGEPTVWIRFCVSTS